MKVDPLEGAVGVPHPMADSPAPPLPPRQVVRDPLQRAVEEEERRNERKAVAVIYDHPADDPKRSAKYGRKCYRMKPYIKVKMPGVRDYMSYALTEEHKRDYPEAWQRYQERERATKDGYTRATILPSVDPAIWKELQDLGLYWVQDIPEHIPGLEEVCADARMFKRLSKPRMKLVGGKLVQINESNT